MSKSAQIAWGIAVFMALVAVGEFFLLDLVHQRALERQAAGYEQKLAQAHQELEQARAEAQARLERTKEEAAAVQQVIQAELDYEKLPELPLKTVLRPPDASGTRVLYVENESRETLSCTIRLQRPGTGEEKEVAFELPGRRFKDLAAVGDWIFKPGDRIEFRKDGYKPRRLSVQ